MKAVRPVLDQGSVARASAILMMIAQLGEASLVAKLPIPTKGWRVSEGVNRSDPYSLKKSRVEYGLDKRQALAPEDARLAGLMLSSS